ncbi:MAG TPA: CPBP family intramembrane glutamic endopeptidase [Rhizomicrobium sp.]|nr:CPBP family intramembrane glutamic endopeptidase [Rhizomicrobium sp.]
MTPAERARVFAGADGLRAGWSLVLYLLLMAAAVFGIATFMPPGGNTTGTLTAKDVALQALPQAAALGIAALIMRRVERRSLAAYGLRRAHAVADFAIGLVTGAAMAGLLVAVLWGAGGLAFRGVALHGTAAATAAGAWLGAMLLLAFVEEFWFRGYLQFTLARGLTGVVRAVRPGLARPNVLGFWLAAAVFSGLFFVLSHSVIAGETRLGVASVAMAGFVFAYGLYRTGALWWSIGFHAAWNWSESCLYGVNDSGSGAQDVVLSFQPHGAAWLSGGSAGPEGSVLVFPVLLATVAPIHALFRRRVTSAASDRR